jgi:peptidyl-prolyl cis-trans isomerase C
MRLRSVDLALRRARPAALTVLLPGFLVHCSRPAASSVGDRAPEGALQATPGADAQRVLARVGTHTITVGDYAAALEHMDEFDRLRYQAPERRKELLDEMINVLLLADEARDRGYDREPEAQEQLREILRDAILKKAREGAPGPDAIPAEQVRGYFEAHQSDFHDPERRRVSVIALPTRAAAERVLDAARTADAGSSWGELVRTHSIERPPSDVPSDLMGDLGFVSPPGDPRGNNPRVPAEVRAAVFEAGPVGEVVPHVVAANGAFYVVKLESKTGAHDRTFEDAERSIRVKLAREAARASEEALLDQLRKQIPVEIDDAALAEVRVDAGPPGTPPSGAPR